MAAKLIWWIGMSVLAAEDFRFRRISLNLLGLWLLPGIWFLAVRIAGGAAATDCLAAAGIGVFLLLLSKATRGAVGEGDGLFFLATACYLDFRETLLLFFASLGISCVWSTGLLLRSRWRGRSVRDTVPFLVCAWISSLWIVGC